MEKKPLIILTGPTAVGKSHLAVTLAKALDGEILSADSMQVYRHMDIGSAKITRGEMGGVPHHLLDVLEPWEDFHVARFQEMAKACITDIYNRGKIPVIVGGTGFYIQAVVKDVDFTETETDLAYRHQMETFAKEYGASALHEKLRQADPAAAENIHANNVKRVIRALEFYHQTGTPISEHNRREQEKQSPYRVSYFVLNDRRERLYERIDRRVDEMVARGLVDEVTELRNMGCTRDMVSMQGLGYKELFAYLDGECTLPEAVCAIKQNTRHFAKRQLTWFRREKEVIWVNKDEFDCDDKKMIDFMIEKTKG